MTTKIEKTQNIEEINASQAYDLAVEKYQEITTNLIETIYGDIRLASENGFFSVDFNILYGEPYTKLIADHFKKLNYRIKISGNDLSIGWGHLDVSASPV